MRAGVETPATQSTQGCPYSDRPLYDALNEGRGRNPGNTQIPVSPAILAIGTSLAQ